MNEYVNDVDYDELEGLFENTLWRKKCDYEGSVFFVEPEEVYDDQENLIYSKDMHGFEEWFDFDERNNCIYYQNSAGGEEWFEYDTENKLIHYRNSFGCEEWSVEIDTLIFGE